MHLLWTFWALGMLAVSPGEVGDHATALVDIDDDSAASLAEILASDVLLQEQKNGNAPEDGRWALRDVLWRDFARCVDPAREINERAGEELRLMRDPSWLEAIAWQAAVMRLRIIPPHKAREVATRVAFDIPLVDHPLVDAYVDYFTGRGRWFFARWLKRADRYIPIMQTILAARGLPRDLVYVAMIESGFSSSAFSSAKASGYWQFIASTGRLYRLRNDAWVDERRDFIRSTEAAAQFLGDLYREFGDWHLAWAGYNGGGGRLRRALARHGEKDFWGLIAHEGSLPRETEHYVPKIIAAAIVAKDRVKYGFDFRDALPPLEYDEIEVKDATRLDEVARRFGLDLSQLRELNPSYLKGTTPPRRRSVLRVPRGYGEEVLAFVRDARPAAMPVAQATHTVVAGDTLWRIAKKHGVSATALRELNDLGHAARLDEGAVLVIPARGGVTQITSKKRVAPAPKVAAAATRSKGTHPRAVAVTKHVVSRGETLWSISQRYGVSVAQMQSWNELSDATVRAGEVLRVHLTSAKEPST